MKTTIKNKYIDIETGDEYYGYNTIDEETNRVSYRYEPIKPRSKLQGLMWALCAMLIGFMLVYLI